MKTLNLVELESINAGDAASGICGGLMGAEAVVGIASVAVHYGWIAAIPGLGAAALVVGAAAVGACAVAAVANA